MRTLFAVPKLKLPDPAMLVLPQFQVKPPDAIVAFASSVGLFTISSKSKEFEAGLVPAPPFWSVPQENRPVAAVHKSFELVPLEQSVNAVPKYLDAEAYPLTSKLVLIEAAPVKLVRLEFGAIVMPP